MAGKEYKTIRFDRADIQASTDIARMKGSTFSGFVREALKAHLSQYTGEPDIHQLKREVDELKSKVNRLEASLEETLKT